MAAIMVMFFLFVFFTVCMGVTHVQRLLPSGSRNLVQNFDITESHCGTCTLVVCDS